MKTREELVSRALNKLGVIGAGQAADADDAELVNNVVVPILSDLAARSIYVFGDPDQIEDQAFEHLAFLVGNAVARDFGVAEDEAARLAAEQRLLVIKAINATGKPQRTEYF